MLAYHAMLEYHTKYQPAQQSASPVCLEHLEAIDIQQTHNSHTPWSRPSNVTSWQRRVDVFHNPLEQTVIDAFSQSISGIGGLLTAQRTGHL